MRSLLRSSIFRADWCMFDGVVSKTDPTSSLQGELVSGVVMAILGYQDEDGDFVAEDVCTANFDDIVLDHFSLISRL